MDLQSSIKQYERVRERKVLVFVMADNLGKLIGGDDARVIGLALKALGPLKELDLILHTEGGQISAARRIAVLLREYVQKLSVVVPVKARSCGTLLALSGCEILLGPGGELSPIDPIVVNARANGANGPDMISSEDVRLFPEMAANWFGLNTSLDRREVFSVLSQKMFPTTLASFYRSQLSVRKAGVFLLSRHLPKASKRVREQIVNELISGSREHSDSILLEEALEIGLRARPISKSAASATSCLLEEALKHCGIHRGASENDELRAAVIATADFESTFILDPNKQPAVVKGWQNGIGRL